MIALFRAELIKLRTTRTFIALASVAVFISLLLTTLVAILSEPTEESVLVDVFTADTSALFILLLGVIGVTGEWRHRTITSSLLAAPDRVRFLAAKAVAYAVAGAAMSVMISVAVAICGFTILSARGLPLPSLGELLAQYGRNVVVAALLAGFGVAFGGLVRNQVMGLVGILVLAFVVEPVLLGLRPDVGRYGPVGALATGASGISAEDAGLGEVDLFSPLSSGLLLLAWIALLFAVAALLLRSRDLT